MIAGVNAPRPAADAAKPETRSFYGQAVVRAAEYVAGHLDAALDLGALAASVNLSPFHFHRIFRGLVGETPRELHRRLRLERAAWALATADAPVTRLASEAGYDTHEAFTRAFRARYGESPSAFRARRATDAAAQATPGARDCARPAQYELAARSGLHFGPGPRGRIALPLTPELDMEITVVDRPALRAAACRHLGAYARITEAFGRLHAAAAPAGLLHASGEAPAGAPQMLAVYYDDPETKAEAELRSDAALTVPRGAAIPPGLSEITIPAGRYAVATHVGPYEQLGDVWARLMGGWLPRSGFRLGPGVTYEVYRNTPADTPPAALRTELYVPVQPDATPGA